MSQLIEKFLETPGACVYVVDDGYIVSTPGRLAKRCTKAQLDEVPADCIDAVTDEWLEECGFERRMGGDWVRDDGVVVSTVHTKTRSDVRRRVATQSALSHSDKWKRITPGFYTRHDGPVTRAYSAWTDTLVTTTATQNPSREDLCS